jgi:hypothetical protein
MNKNRKGIIGDAYFTISPEIGTVIPRNRKHIMDVMNRAKKMLFKSSNSFLKWNNLKIINEKSISNSNAKGIISLVLKESRMGDINMFLRAEGIVLTTDV